MRSIRILAVIALLLVSVSAFAQLTTGTLTGTVTSGGIPFPAPRSPLRHPACREAATPSPTVTATTTSAVSPPATTSSVSSSGAAIRQQEGQGRSHDDRPRRCGPEGHGGGRSDHRHGRGTGDLETTEVQTNITAKLVEKLPMGRTLVATVTLAPGVTATASAAAWSSPAVRRMTAPTTSTARSSTRSSAVSRRASSSRTHCRRPPCRPARSRPSSAVSPAASSPRLEVRRQRLQRLAPRLVHQPELDCPG